MGKLIYTNVKDTITQARIVAKKEAKKETPTVRSRGAWLIATDDKNERLNESETWFVTDKASITMFVEKFRDRAKEIYIEGGFDGANSLKDFNDGDYQPWTSAWSFKLWVADTEYLRDMKVECQ